MSGYTQEYYACVNSKNQETGIVYGNLAGGNQGTYLIPETDKK